MQKKKQKIKAENNFLIFINIIYNIKFPINNLKNKYYYYVKLCDNIYLYYLNFKFYNYN